MADNELRRVLSISILGSNRPMKVGDEWDQGTITDLSVHYPSHVKVSLDDGSCVLYPWPQVAAIHFTDVVDA